MSKYERVYNFSAGPSMLPLEVLENVQKDLLNYKGTGESVMEMSHRSAEFKAIIEDAEADLRKLMNIPDNYKVLFLQGGGTLQFSMIPLNLLRKSKKADYIVTGQWAKKAYKEACKFGDIKCVASSEEDTYSYIPEVSREDFRADADYVYICYNNTIYGSKFPYIPDTGDIPLVADMSSCILSEEVDVSRFGVIWAGAQKNVAPAGVTIVIIREDLIRETMRGILRGETAPEDLPRVFEKGYTGSNGRTDKRATGIGLYLCRRILEKLGHTIAITSEVGVGTTVRIGLQQDALEVE